MKSRLFTWTLFLSIFAMVSALNSADVYLVIGSDTAIWDGMNTARFNEFYNIDLYTNPQRNAYRIMDPAFRARLVDSDGNPLKMTWWMMAGNIFRYAVNTNVPIPNIMTMYLMKTYHGRNIELNGDELSLHYHTFIWSDFNGDGRYYWNQAKKFMDCYDDFNYTLAQYLLEEKVFPVSFRSGWHYMDNDWQRYLDDYILPYSMHNDYPSKHIDTDEPIDNNYDWSLAPSAFVPFHPSEENYQLPGNGKGWNVRSAHFYRVLHDDLIDTVFAAAQNGKDQVACFWGHLPERDFVTNIEKIDSLAHERIKKYPNVRFHYCTAVEAMQRWRKSNDSQAPQIEFSEKSSGDDVYFQIQSDEAIFQKVPFVAVKDVYEDYRVLPCEAVGDKTWQTTIPVKRQFLAKAAVAVCDTFGNQTLKYIQYLPDDVFVDNSNENFSTLSGSWQETQSGVPWGMSALICPLNGTDSAVARWSYRIKQETLYNVFVRNPEVANPAGDLKYTIFLNGIPEDTILFSDPIPARTWQYLTTVSPHADDLLTVELQVPGKNQNGKNAVADVVKISALVRDRDLRVSRNFIEFGAVSWGDTVEIPLILQNAGRQPLTVYSLQTAQKAIHINIDLPLEIGPMSRAVVPIRFYSEQMGRYTDTLTVNSNDPKKPQVRIPIMALVQNYFLIIDNEDTVHYHEFGQWHYSNDQAYGSTSRYAWLNSTPKAYARFSEMLKKSGVYELFEIVPKTKNASNRALYKIVIDSIVVDSLFIDQNEGSGDWRSLGLYYLPENVPLEIRVIDTGMSTAGQVLRADAVKFSLIKEITDLDISQSFHRPQTYALEQNYPNPFNTTTTIRFALSESGPVELNVFNLSGRKIRTLLKGYRQAGYYKVQWNGRDAQGRPVASGMYFVQLRIGKTVKNRKMILLK